MLIYFRFKNKVMLEIKFGRGGDLNCSRAHARTKVSAYNIRLSSAA